METDMDMVTGLLCPECDFSEGARRDASRAPGCFAGRSRGFFDTLLRRTKSSFKPTYNHQPDGSACRIYGTITAKRPGALPAVVTANLHVTTLGHGYASHEHVDHKFMNLSHVITEFSFGPDFLT
ncbi:hypothetical protein BD309DRAFT_1047315 [Dichomitus squalens]|nr:hypothetical protein BD309DRAFT_1047315 [Dichomitus squalens]